LALATAQRRDGRDTFLIGGETVSARGREAAPELVLRLSAMTLPHAWRGCCSPSKLYRASSILHNIPTTAMIKNPAKTLIYLASRSRAADC